MIVLDNTTGKIQAVLAASASNQPEYFASYRDITTSAYTPGKNTGVLNSTTDVDIVAAPAASTQRVIDYLSVWNSDSSQITLTLKHDDVGVERRLWKGVIEAGGLVTYVDGTGWTKFTSAGVPIVNGGVAFGVITGEVTLATSTTTTTITDSGILSGSQIVLFPKTANAAGAALVHYASSVAAGSITLTHNNSVLADRTFRYAIFI